MGYYKITIRFILRLIMNNTLQTSLFLRSFILYILLFVVFHEEVFSQTGEPCGTMAYSKWLVSQDPSLPQKRSKAARRIQEQLSSFRVSAIGKIYQIPVVVHVVWNTQAVNIPDAQIFSQIETLNQDYQRLNSDTINTPDIFKPVAADAGFQFSLAAIDPSGQPTTGIVRTYTDIAAFSYDNIDTSLKPLSYWPSDQYLNIWVTNLQDQVLGISPDPTDVYYGINESQNDGIVIYYQAFGNTASTKYNLGRTTTHEVGHWLGLIHIWGDEDCGSDSVADTPTQFTSSLNMSLACTPTVSSCIGAASQDMSQNYLDYSPDKCMNIFTQGQAARMRTVMEMNPLRVAIQNSPALPATVAGTIPAFTENAIALYPNPARDFITVSLPNTGKQNVDLLFFNSTGQQVFSVKEFASGSDGMINVAPLSAGIYYVKIISDDQSTTLTKLVKL
jgi:hypothetical protein